MVLPKEVLAILLMVSTTSLFEVAAATHTRTNKAIADLIFFVLLIFIYIFRAASPSIYIFNPREKPPKKFRFYGDKRIHKIIIYL